MTKISSNDFMNSLKAAQKNGEINYTGGKAQKVTVELGEGNADININASKVNVSTGTGTQRVQVLGDDVSVELDKNAAANWDFSDDFDAVAVVTDTDKGKVKVDMGDGGGYALAVGNDVKVAFGDAKNGKGKESPQTQLTNVWGSKNATAQVTYGDGGTSYTTTLDKSAANGAWDAATNNFDAKVLDAASEALQKTTKYGEAEIVSMNKISETVNKKDFMNAIKTYYGDLDSKQLNKISELYDSGELFATLSDGTPKYAILESDTQKNADGSKKYVLSKIDKYNPTTGYIHAWGYGYDSNNTRKAVNDFKDCIATDSTGKTVPQSEMQRFDIIKTTVYDVTEKQEWKTEGIGELKVTGGNKSYNLVDATLSGNLKKAESNVKFGNTNKGTDINVTGSYTWKSITDNYRKEVQDSFVWGMLKATGGTHQSPIVVDFNQDGKVSAKAGAGVDIDQDGIGDGYASDGDKMLAMSDVNKSGAIDGSEVFGDQTVSPFTGEKLNAANGFEALKMIAQEAEQYTGIKCLKNGDVDLRLLKSALETVGVNLGFISESNVSELEDLAHVASINVEEYDEVDATGDVQHRQLGSYKTVDDETYSANDVWFKTSGKKTK